MLSPSSAYELAGSAASSFADDGESKCFTDLLNCYQEAAKIADFWYRFAAGLDCELDFIECARIKIIGN